MEELGLISKCKIKVCYNIINIKASPPATIGTIRSRGPYPHTILLSFLPKFTTRVQQEQKYVGASGKKCAYAVLVQAFYNAA